MQMIVIILYLLLVFAVLIFLIGLSVFTISLIWSGIMGAPYVPSSEKEIKEILKKANLKKGQRFVELGSGDARTVRWAVKEYGVKGSGIDINPVLTFWAKLLSRFQKIKQIDLHTGNIYHVDLRKADVIYVFLMPEMLTKLQKKFESELRDNVLIISHGFAIAYLEPMREDIRNHKPFSTYYYRYHRARLKK